MAKMFRYIKGFGLVTVSVALIAALLVGSVVPAKAEPQKVVKVGLCAVFAGPLATVGKPCTEGMIDYTRYINEQGGINGIKIETPWYDARGLVPQTIAAHRRLVDQGIVLEHVLESTAAEVLLPSLQRDGIPVTAVVGYTSAMTSKPQWIVASFDAFPCALVMTAKWIKENLWVEARPMRIGVMFFDAAVGWSMLDAAKYVDKLGAEWVGHEIIPLMGCIDTSTEWIRLARKKPDWVFLTAVGAPAVVAVKDAARLGIQQQGVKLCGCPNCVEECVLAVAGRSADGWYATKVTPSYFETESSPFLKTIAEKAKEYRGMKPEDLKGYYIGGWAHAMIGVEGIRLAIEKVGYENLTGRAVRDGLFSIKDFDTGLIPPTTITENSPFITRRVQICEIREGEFHPITWMEPVPSFYISPEELERALEK